MQPQWRQFIVQYRRPDRTDMAHGVVVGAATQPLVGTVQAVATGACAALLPCVRVRKSTV